MNAKMLSLYCSAQISIRNFVDTQATALRERRESGQATIEYIAIIVLLAAALAVGFIAMQGITKGPLVDFVQNVIKAGLNAALKALGISVEE